MGLLYNRFFTLQYVIEFIWLNLLISFPFSCLTIADKSTSDEKLKRVNDNSSKGGKTASEERLRPVGASAEEDNGDDMSKSESKESKTDSSGERSVQIIIKPQTGSSTDSEGQDPQFLPPIV